MRRNVHRPKISDALLAGFRVAGCTVDGSIVCIRERHGERAIVVTRPSSQG
jgi:hypothetical protein